MKIAPKDVVWPVNSAFFNKPHKILEKKWKNKHAIMENKNVLNRIAVEILRPKCAKGKEFNLI